jgi:hypothetical protein
VLVQWLEGRSYAAKTESAAVGGVEGSDPTALFLLLLQHTREVCQLFGRMKQLCGFDITERAQTELQRKGAAFELVRWPSIPPLPSVVFPSHARWPWSLTCRCIRISRR